jgi:hypothetical protein
MRDLRAMSTFAWFLFVGSTISAQAFTVASLIGTWSGTCTQTETSAQGAVEGTLTQLGPAVILADWKTPAAFGCGAVPDGGGYALTRGNKRVGYTNNEIHVRNKPKPAVDPWGVKLQIKTKGDTILLTGRKACGGLGPKKYSARGTVSGTTMTITAQATVQGEVAHVTCTVTKNPAM